MLFIKIKGNIFTASSVHIQEVRPRPVLQRSVSSLIQNIYKHHKKLPHEKERRYAMKNYNPHLKSPQLQQSSQNSQADLRRHLWGKLAKKWIVDQATQNIKGYNTILKPQRRQKGVYQELIELKRAMPNTFTLDEFHVSPR